MKILHLIFSTTNLSVSEIYIQGLRENGIEVLDYAFEKKGLKKYIKIFKICLRYRKEADLIMVGHSSPQIAIFVRLFWLKKIIYNALCSEYERYIISRNVSSKFSLKAYYYWTLDFLACRASNLVMLETKSQVEFFEHMFMLSPKKSFVAYTGVDDKKFFYKQGIEKFSDFTVIFRGRLLPEAGYEYVVEAAKLLEKDNIKFIMLSSGRELPKLQKLIEKIRPENLQLISDFLPIEKLRELMLKSHLSLGQLSGHDRLNRTIPHKAFETLALRLPYLTAKSQGVTELLKEGETVIFCNQADAADLAKKISWAREHQEELTKIADNGYRLYTEQLTPKILAGKLLEKIN